MTAALVGGPAELELNTVRSGDREAARIDRREVEEVIPAETKNGSRRRHAGRGTGARGSNPGAPDTRAPRRTPDGPAGHRRPPPDARLSFVREQSRRGSRAVRHGESLPGAAGCRGVPKARHGSRLESSSQNQVQPGSGTCRRPAGVGTPFRMHRESGARRERQEKTGARPSGTWQTGAPGRRRSGVKSSYLASISSRRRRPAV